MKCVLFYFKIILLSQLLNSPLIFAGEVIPPATLELGHKIALTSKVMANQRNISVRLPADYNNSKRDYPVIYLLDADFYIGSIYQDSVAVIERLERYGDIPQVIIIGGDIPQVIIIGVGSEHWYSDSIDQPEQFQLYLQQELIPYVKKNYRTLDNTMLVGHSYAGVFVINTMTEDADSFDTLLAVSPIFPTQSIYQDGTLGLN